MRAGAVRVEGRQYRVHVVTGGTEEATAIVAFRDCLRSSPVCGDSYARLEREILARGICDSVAYAEAEDVFFPAAPEPTPRHAPDDPGAARAR